MASKLYAGPKDKHPRRSRPKPHPATISNAVTDHNFSATPGRVDYVGLLGRRTQYKWQVQGADDESLELRRSAGCRKRGCHREQLARQAADEVESVRCVRLLSAEKVQYATHSAPKVKSATLF